MDTAVVCPTCSGEGSAPGTHPETCEVCASQRRDATLLCVVETPGDLPSELESLSL